jgi:hypothetical protein
MTRHSFLETLEALYITYAPPKFYNQLFSPTLFIIFMVISCSEAVEVVLLSFERKYHMDVSFTITMALTQYTPLAGGFSPAKFTRNCLPSCSCWNKKNGAKLQNSSLEAYQNQGGTLHMMKQTAYNIPTKIRPSLNRNPFHKSC